MDFIFKVEKEESKLKKSNWIYFAGIASLFFTSIYTFYFLDINKYSNSLGGVAWIIFIILIARIIISDCILYITATITALCRKYD